MLSIHNGQPSAIKIVHVVVVHNDIEPILPILMRQIYHQCFDINLLQFFIFYNKKTYFLK
jgi:hypothetical protein